MWDVNGSGGIRRMLKHSILQLLNEHEAMNLSELSTRLETDAEDLRHEIEQMMYSGSNVRLRDDIVYVSRKYENVLWSIPIIIFVLIVLLPAYMGWN